MIVTLKVNGGGKFYLYTDDSRTVPALRAEDLKEDIAYDVIPNFNSMAVRINRSDLGMKVLDKQNHSTVDVLIHMSYKDDVYIENIEVEELGETELDVVWATENEDDERRFAIGLISGKYVYDMDRIIPNGLKIQFMEYTTLIMSEHTMIYGFPVFIQPRIPGEVEADFTIVVKSHGVQIIASVEPEVIKKELKTRKNMHNSFVDLPSWVIKLLRRTWVVGFTIDVMAKLHDDENLEDFFELMIREDD